jgi:hypothetical protein
VRRGRGDGDDRPPLVLVGATGDAGQHAAQAVEPPGTYIVASSSAGSVVEGVRAGIEEILGASTAAAEWHAAWARRWGRIYLWLGLPASILAAVAGATGLASAAGRLPAALMALGAAALGSAATFLESGQRRQYHEAMSSAWQVLANDAHVYLLAYVPDGEWLSTSGRETYGALSQRRSELIGLRVPGERKDHE